MRKLIPIFLAFVVVATMVATTAQAQRPAAYYIAASWNNDAVHFLDAGFNNISSFGVPAGDPNGLATNGNLIWAGSPFANQVTIFDMAGAIQGSWAAPGEPKEWNTLMAKSLLLTRGMDPSISTIR